MINLSNCYLAKAKNRKLISSFAKRLKCNKEREIVKSMFRKEKSIMKGSIATQNMISQSGKSSEEVMISNVCTGNKLVTTKPWFPKSQMFNKHRLSSEGTLLSVSTVS